jgi:hypothetical protein
MVTVALVPPKIGAHDIELAVKVAEKPLKIAVVDTKVQATKVAVANVQPKSVIVKIAEKSLKPAVVDTKIQIAKATEISR